MATPAGPLSSAANSWLDCVPEFEGRVCLDPLTASPQRMWDTTAVSDQDLALPNISNVVTAQNGQLLAADFTNAMVKVVTTSIPPTVSCVKLDQPPMCFASLSDGLVALTAFNKTVFFLDPNGGVTVKSRIQTTRQYYGAADGPGDDTLIVGSYRSEDGPACVDAIRRDGVVVRRVADEAIVLQLEKPMSICVTDSHLIIPDIDRDCVYRMEVATGHLVDTLTHPDLKKPAQVVADELGNMYMACKDGQCILVLTASGQWRRLLYGPQHSDKNLIYPVKLCLTKTGLVVVWWNSQRTGSAHLLIGYNLA